MRPEKPRPKRTAEPIDPRHVFSRLYWMCDRCGQLQAEIEKDRLSCRSDALVAGDAALRRISAR
jgi:hypothetical protein